MALPEGLSEASGVAVSRAYPGIYWTHDDGSEPYLRAVDAAGSLVGSVRLEGARLVDWEDLALASCGAATCLYVADTGDNSEQRSTLVVYRLREPDPRSDSVATVEAIEMRLPDGPRDVEALFLLPDERIHLVSKGRRHPVTVYRYPGAPRPGTVVELAEVQRLGGESPALPRQVTGASASLDGERVAVRTYEALYLFRLQGDTLAALEKGTVALSSLRESQGEGVGVGEDGLIAFTSEAGPMASRGSLALARCEG